MLIPTTNNKEQTKIPMALSSNVDSTSAAQLPSEPNLPAVTSPTTPEAVTGQPNLFQIPKNLYPTYRTLPLGWKLTVGFLSTIGYVANSYGSVGWWSPLKTMMRESSYKRLAGVLLKALTTYLVACTILQDFFRAPSRISLTNLLSKYYLPSSLSKYNTEKGVHYLQCDHHTDANSSSRILYLNHGFGACSLSWLPALPALTKALDCRTGLGHDAPGFGFTQRFTSLDNYTSVASAKIGISLLNEIPKESVVLMGHSMGAITTLHMATKIEQRKRIILVAPALGIREPSKKRRPTGSWIPRSLLDAPAAYILRRVVGRPGFWRKGLSLAWGDKSRLSDADVLRFQWPSVVEGWERGLLNFARGQRSEISDHELLKRVLAMPDTTVDVIVGSNDRIVSPAQIRKFFHDFPNVRVVELAGLGHDPFEEDVERFIQAVKQLIALRNTSTN